MNKDYFLLFYLMIPSFYKKLTLYSLALISFVACTKDNSDPASMLMGKAWSPYQVEILTIDSSRVGVLDKSTGEQKETNSVLKTDTTYLVSACQQNSVYQFKANGVQIITDACSYNISDFNNTWTVTQTGQISFSQFVTGLVPVTGLLSEINTSQFVFNSIGINYAFGNSTDADGNQVSTTDIITTTRILTFKSRL
jgi:hypothetical protein